VTQISAVAAGPHQRPLHVASLGFPSRLVVIAQSCKRAPVVKERAGRATRLDGLGMVWPRNTRRPAAACRGLTCSAPSYTCCTRHLGREAQITTAHSGPACKTHAACTSGTFRNCHILPSRAAAAWVGKCGDGTRGDPSAWEAGTSEQAFHHASQHLLHHRRPGCSHLFFIAQQCLFVVHHSCAETPRLLLHMLHTRPQRPATTLRTPPSTAIISPLTYVFFVRKSTACAISAS
jgi:hypothetical protein